MTNVGEQLKKKPALRGGGFTFKQFFVAHDRCAMKVGTDGVLLGAWAPVEKARKVLDIGCGSGLIALMIAQRSAPEVEIDGVELEPEAAQQASSNAAQSPWAERVHIYAQDVHQFAESHPHQYDLIVSNPPYFAPAVACRDEARDTARYTGSLTHDALLNCAEKLITKEGIFCVVLPHDLGEELARLAVQQDWFVHCQVDIRDRPGKPLHRMLLTLSRQPAETQYQHLDLRQSEGVYSPEFCALISEFYLNY
ncbi:putative S-adenosyl-L-methionine-dependent methyltransferase [Yersinia frederiksenii]|nr:putative S-adenosyl-L-methionine-dependent methyltransferase [Yersinia frederiksenii]CND10068.1 putative S-adenosyl-L-methionine-dependent methyltransferase [Yersinia frederiksenii]CNI51838.1 putative S-adenosyl-L-methionine-dependent methyltransferase [Yersinia frederiksenii]CNL19809.1 putative S-adenosyl-L-methionine-dependent methyltransferase [Yersinia frederiksenii]CNL36662.1 putative S-adenosyl-L-methionine-dependent methyltransferase [Yersinia frederiksenii]